MGTSGRHLRGGSGWLPILAMAFVAAFIILAISGAFPLHISRPDDGPPRGSAAIGDGDSQAEAGASPTEGPPNGCKHLWAHELRVALAAERTLQEWRLHIETMDQLVAGDITLEQAEILWDASRRGDLHRIHQFERLDANLQRSPSECDPAEAAGMGTACEQAAHAVERTIDAARTAVRTWHIHIQDMKMLRAGEIDSAEATQRWHELWRTGQIETVRYDHRAAQALGHHCA